MENQQKQEQIEDDQNQPVNQHQQVPNTEQEHTEETTSKKDTYPQSSRLDLDHESISRYANFTLDIENDEKNQVYLRVVGTQTKGTAFTKYTAYILKGHDKKGQINIFRRFNQFHQLRSAMVSRWPGCFIPSIPTKNILHKNDPDITQQRERFLNNFVIKMTKLPHLYNSEQFQLFLRSKQVDVSKNFSTWSHPSHDDIINKYKESFSNLTGKKIDSNVGSSIGLFYARIKKNEILLQKYRGYAKALALAKDTMNQNYPNLFTKVLPGYEKHLLSQYIDGKQQYYVYENAQQPKLSEHSQIIKTSTATNPYWQLYDLIKNQERDGRAFLQALNSREKYQNYKLDIDGKIRDNQKTILDLMQGKINIKSLTTKGTNDEIKYKLEVENTELAKEKESLLTLTDIILAIIVYIQIPAYENAKANFYIKTLKKIGGFQLNSVQVEGDIWKDVMKSSSKIRSNCFKDQ